MPWTETLVGLKLEGAEVALILCNLGLPILCLTGGPSPSAHVLDSCARIRGPKIAPGYGTRCPAGPCLQGGLCWSHEANLLAPQAA